ncbi:MAG: divalent-cation tolerance protein CutA [Alphaproteobacteria bacterium]|nr:divalent-cation tolerance protein CutA [Alphaproteobacteria bacterium]
MTRPESAMGLLYTTWPDGESAEAAAEALLAEGLIACANILGEARSVFRWKGEVQRETETIALFKTSAARAGRTAARIADLHPYDEPAVLNLCVDSSGSSPAFLSWVASETGDPPG